MYRSISSPDLPPPLLQLGVLRAPRFGAASAVHNTRSKRLAAVTLEVTELIPDLPLWLCAFGQITAPLWACFITCEIGMPTATTTGEWWRLNDTSTDVQQALPREAGAITSGAHRGCQQLCVSLKTTLAVCDRNPRSSRLKKTGNLLAGVTGKSEGVSWLRCDWIDLLYSSQTLFCAFGTRGKNLWTPSALLCLDNVLCYSYFDLGLRSAPF